VKPPVFRSFASAGAPPNSRLTAGSFVPDAHTAQFSPINYYSIGEPSFNVDQVTLLVLANKLLVNPQLTKMLVSQAGENLPGALQLDLVGGLYFKNHGFAGYGGIQGSGGGLAGSLLSGNALTAAGSAVVGSLGGDLMDWLTGTIPAQRSSNRLQTKVDDYDVTIEAFKHARHAQRLFFDMWGDWQKVQREKEFIAELQRGTGARVNARVAEGDALSMAGADVLSKENDAQTRIISLEGKMRKDRDEINLLTGHSIGNLEDTFYAKMPQAGNFRPISDAEKGNLVAGATADDGKNPELQQKMVAFQKMLLDRRIQGFSALPRIELTDLYGTRSPGGSLVSLLSGGVENTSKLLQNNNGIISLLIPIPGLNQKFEILNNISDIEVKAAALNIMITKLRLALRVLHAVENYNTSGALMIKVRGEYGAMDKYWRSIAANYPEQVIGFRVKAEELWKASIDRQVGLFNAQAEFWQLGVGLNRAMLTQTPFRRKFVFLLAAALIAGMPLASAFGQGLSPQNQKGALERNPAIEYALSLGGTKTEILDRVVDTAITDGYIGNRMAALYYVITQYEGKSDFIQSLFKIIFTTTHQDIVQELFNIMIARRDLPFCVLVMDKADAEHHRATTEYDKMPSENKKAAIENSAELFARAYQAFLDILTNDPKLAKTFSGKTFAGIPPKIAEKAVLYLLADTNPSAAIPRERVLLNDQYMGSVYLAQKVNALMNWVKKHVKDLPNGPMTYEQLKEWLEKNPTGLANPQTKSIMSIMNLTGLLLHSLERQVAISNIPQAFPWPFGVFLRRDNTDTGWQEAMKEENAFFLQQSPRWQDMPRYIYPRLWQKTKEATIEIIALNPADAPSEYPLYEYTQNPKKQFLEHFESLSPTGKDNYINDSQNLSELTRIAQAPTSHRAHALNRVMADPSLNGPRLVLAVEAGSKDEDLLQSIQERSEWKNIVWAVVQGVDDPATMDGVQKGLLSMYYNTGQPWLLDARDATFRSMELDQKLIEEPRGIQAVNALKVAKTAQWGLQVMDLQDANAAKWFTGYFVRDPEERALLNAISAALRDKTPLDFVTYYREQDPRGLGNLPSVQEEFYKKADINDQSPIHWIPTLIGIMIGIAGFIVAALMNAWLGIWDKFRRLFRNNDANRLNRVDKENERLKKTLYGVNGPQAASQERAADKALLAPPAKETYKPALDYLNAWQKKVDDWSARETMTAQEMLDGLDAILFYGFEALRKMPYSPQLIWSDDQPLNQSYLNAYSYFITLAADTLKAMESRLQQAGFNATLNEIQRQQFLQYKSGILDSMKYASLFFAILKYRSTIETVMGYKFPDGDPREGVYWLLRKYLLYQRLLDASNRDLRKGLKDLLEIGNALMPGFYNNPDDIIQESEERLDYVIKEGRTAYNPQPLPDRKGHKNRRFYGRLLTALSGPVLLTLSLTLSFLGFTNVGLYGAVISVMVIMSTLYNFHQPHKKILRMEEFESMQWSIRKNKNILNDLLDKSGKYQNGQPLAGENNAIDLAKYKEKKIIAIEKQEGLKAVKAELQDQQNIDAIVIISEDGNEVDSLKQHRDSLRGPLLRSEKELPVEVMTPAFEGSGNAYYEALLMMKRKFEGEYKQEYPHLKRWEDARILFIFHGKEAVQNNMLIDWSIINGYRAAASMAQNGEESGNIVIFSRDVYFGPIQQVRGADYTLVTARENRHKLGSLGLVITRFLKNGTNEIGKILEKVNVASIEEQGRSDDLGSRTLDFFDRELYDRSNWELEQYPVFNGITMIGPEGKAMDQRTAEAMEEQHLLGQAPFHFVSDDIIAKIEARNSPVRRDWNRRINDYVEERVTWDDMVRFRREREVRLSLSDAKASLKNAYSIIRGNVKPGIKIFAQTPAPFMQVYYSNITKESPRGDLVENLLGDIMPALHAQMDRAMPSDQDSAYLKAHLQALIDGGGAGKIGKGKVVRLNSGWADGQKKFNISGMITYKRGNGQLSINFDIRIAGGKMIELSIDKRESVSINGYSEKLFAILYLLAHDYFQRSQRPGFKSIELERPPVRPGDEESRQKTDAFFTRIAARFQKEGGDKNEVLKIEDDKYALDSEQFDWGGIRDFVLQPDHAQISRKNTGGIDLNFQPQFIPRGPRINPDDTSGSPIKTFGNDAGAPGEFKGFNFNIVRFIPALTVNAAFQLMFK
jgi:hypothetical protein